MIHGKWPHHIQSGKNLPRLRYYMHARARTLQRDQGRVYLWLPMHTRVHGAYYVLDLGTWPIPRRLGKDKEQAPQSILPTGRHLCAQFWRVRKNEPGDQHSNPRHQTSSRCPRSGSYSCDGRCTSLHSPRQFILVAPLNDTNLCPHIG